MKYEQRCLLIKQCKETNDSIERVRESFDSISEKLWENLKMNVQDDEHYYHAGSIIKEFENLKILVWEAFKALENEKHLTIE